MFRFKLVMISIGTVAVLSLPLVAAPTCLQACGKGSAIPGDREPTDETIKALFHDRMCAFKELRDLFSDEKTIDYVTASAVGSYDLPVFRFTKGSWIHEGSVVSFESVSHALSLSLERWQHYQELLRKTKVKEIANRGDLSRDQVVFILWDNSNYPFGSTQEKSIVYSDREPNGVFVTSIDAYRKKSRSLNQLQLNARLSRNWFIRFVQY
ncbi:MAG: hypothetical protein KC777_11040 [Cyanobacteria bacterium HKST-UBA02]|nr:hypothetical protein [Cyanobacteria bacterium HKST-UBA02]